MLEVLSSPLFVALLICLLLQASAPNPSVPTRYRLRVFGTVLWAMFGYKVGAALGYVVQSQLKLPGIVVSLLFYGAFAWHCAARHGLRLEFPESDEERDRQVPNAFGILAVCLLSVAVASVLVPRVPWAGLPYSGAYDATLLASLTLIHTTPHPPKRTALRVFVQLLGADLLIAFLGAGLGQAFATAANGVPIKFYELLWMLAVTAFVMARWIKVQRHGATRVAFTANAVRALRLSSLRHNIRSLMYWLCFATLIAALVSAQTAVSSAALLIGVVAYRDFLRPSWQVPALLGLAHLTLLKWAGVYRPTTDNLVFLVSFGVAVLSFVNVAPGSGAKRIYVRQHLGAYAIAICVWIVAISILDPLRGLTAMQSTPSARAPKQREGVRVALALSGGGYRAALVHAGVLDALDELGVPITHLTGVSGGSIIAAYYAAGGRPKDFLTMAEGKAFHLRRELLHIRNLVQLPFPFRVPGTSLALFPWYSFSRADVQANTLDRLLYRQVSFEDITRKSGPILMLSATDLKTGMAVGIVNDGVLLRQPLNLRNRYEFINRPPTPYIPVSNFIAAEGEFPKKTRLSQLVTASGAFPLAFDPLSFGLRFKDGPESLHMPLVLADGGISDNSGIPLLQDARLESGRFAPRFRIAGPEGMSVRKADSNWQPLRDWDFDIAIASDASAIFSYSTEASTPLSSVARAIDVIYRNVKPRSTQPGASLPKTYVLSPETILEQRPRDLRSLIWESVGGPVPMAIRMGSIGKGRAAVKSMLASLPRAEELEEREGWYRLAYWGRLARESSAGKSWSQKLDEWRALIDADDDTQRPRRLSEFEAAVRDELDRGLRTFAETSTLNDQISTTDARQLFRLGRLLVAIEYWAIEAHLDALEFDKQAAQEMWQALTKAAGISDAQRAPFDAVAEARSEYLSDRLRPNGVIPRSSEALALTASVIGRDGSESRRRFSEASSMIAASLAHRVAHRVRRRTVPDDGSITDSLYDEIRNLVEWGTLEEGEIDRQTIDLLCRAGVDPEGGARMMERTLDEHGASGTHPRLRERLDNWRRNAQCVRSSAHRATGR